MSGMLCIPIYREASARNEPNEREEWPLGTLLSRKACPLHSARCARGLVGLDGCPVCCSCRSCGRPLGSGWQTFWQIRCRCHRTTLTTFVPAGSAGSLAIGGAMSALATLRSVTDATLFVPDGSETVDRAPQARRSAFWLFPNCTADRSAETVLKEVNPATVLDFRAPNLRPSPVPLVLDPGPHLCGTPDIGMAAEEPFWVELAESPAPAPLAEETSDVLLSGYARHSRTLARAGGGEPLPAR